jgi:GNAT superfamily N-acetyltransferase
MNASAHQDTITIEEWDDTHPRRAELTALIEALGQTGWVAFDAEWHQSSHMFVALREGQVVGFLRLVLQEIGREDELPPVSWQGNALVEAKILAFGVAETHRRQGIGLALQQTAIRFARAKGCYQVRSHSSGTNRANHQLKLSLGFGVHPILRGEDSQGAYFILPLRVVEP